MQEPALLVFRFKCCCILYVECSIYIPLLTYYYVYFQYRIMYNFIILFADFIWLINTLKICCSITKSHFCSPLCDLCCPSLVDYCSSWRKGLRTVSLPYDFRSDYLPFIADFYCRRHYTFVFSCYSGTSNIIRFAAHHVVLCGQERSPIGRNVMFCAIHFRFMLDKSFN